MPEEYQNDYAYDNQFLFKGCLQGVYRLLYQSGTVVGCYDLHAFWQRRFYFIEFGLDALYDIQSVFAVADYYNATDRVAFSVKISDAAPYIRAHCHRAEISDCYRRASVVNAHDNIFYVFNLLYISSAPHHVFHAAEFHESSAHVIIAVADGVYNLH